MKTTAFIIFFIFFLPLMGEKFLGVWYTTDGNNIFTLTIASGTYLFTVNDQTVGGTWEKDGDTGLKFTDFKGNINVYQYSYKDDYLILTQTATNYMVLSQSEDKIKELIKKVKNGEQLFTNDNSNKTKTTTAVTTNNNSTTKLTDKEIAYLFQNYKTMEPDTVYNYITRLPQYAIDMLKLSEAGFYRLIYRACEGSAAYKNSTDSQSCAMVKKSYQQTKSLGVEPTQYGDQQVAELLVWINCKTGTYSKKSCSTYYKTKMNINNMQHKTNMNIINNMGNSGCTKRYDAKTNQYIGCW